MRRSRLSVGAKVLLGGAALIVVAAMVPFIAVLGGFYKNFHVPSEAMSPTLQVGDAFVARMGIPEPLAHGDIVLVGIGNATYIKRVAALGGDTIELRGGVVILNGREVPQRRLGEDRIEGFRPDTLAIRLSEQFPGEATAHEIYDMGPSQIDDMPPLTIPANHVFLLGDNRDNSADSRVSRDVMGVGGAVPISDLRGRPWWFYRRSARNEG